MSQVSPWIPVDEMMPEPWQLVFVWTDYVPCNFFRRPEIPGDPRTISRLHLFLTVTQGFVGKLNEWHLSYLGSCHVHNSKVHAHDDPGHGLLGPVNVLFWMPMPPAPPGLSYPPLRDGVSPFNSNPPQTEVE